jgi:hypothetical protein
MEAASTWALIRCNRTERFGCGSRIYSNTDIAKNCLDGEAHEGAT